MTSKPGQYLALCNVFTYASYFSLEVTSWGHIPTLENRKPKLLEQIRMSCLRRHYSPRTATSYVYWCRQYILFHKKRHPKELGKTEMELFLNYLVKKRHLSASSQSQALNALFFMYKQVLEIELGWLDKLARVKRKQSLPTVLSVQEVREVLGQMTGTPKLMAELIYGTGMRVSECTQLRIKDIDFDLKIITVRHGKGGKDRTTLLPHRLVRPLQQHLLHVMGLHKDDCLKGAGFTPLPDALYKKYPKAAQSIGWQYVFPSSVIRVWPQTGQHVRWHCSNSTPQRCLPPSIESNNHHQTRQHSYLAALFCDAPSSKRHGYSEYSDTSGSSQY